MRVLVTNGRLVERGGTELYAKDLARALQRRGHQVAVYSSILGQAAVDFRRAGLQGLDDLEQMPWSPDVIHGHHHLETMTALLRFPATPAVFVSHGWVPWPEAPPRHPRVLRYVAVDEPTRDHAVQRHGIPPARIAVVPNFVDLERFRPRPPLPPRPRRALVFSNYMSESEDLAIIRRACAMADIAVDAVGAGVGQPVEHPEAILGEYDLVFAKGRAALEAAAVGAAVIVCDTFVGLGPLITTRNVAAMRTLEGQGQSFWAPVSIDGLRREIRGYDATEAGRVSEWVRSVAGLERGLSFFIDLYRGLIEELAHRPADPGEEARAFAAYLAEVSRYVKQSLVERTVMGHVAVKLRDRLSTVPFIGSRLCRLATSLGVPVPVSGSSADS